MGSERFIRDGGSKRDHSSRIGRAEEDEGAVLISPATVFIGGGGGCNSRRIGPMTK